MSKIYAKGFLKKAKDNGVFMGAVASTGATDRDGETLDPKGWNLNNFKKAPRLLWGHDSKELPIGKVTDVKTDKKGKLIFDAEVAEKENDFAKKVANLMRGGFLNTFSVGFRPIERDGDTFTKMELLEISVVNVPANAEARLSHEYKAFNKMAKKVEKEGDIADIRLKPEETKKYIRIPVNDCKVTATITISKKEGIKALYCGKKKKIRTYLFLKSKGWTMAKAKKWVRDHTRGKDAMVLVIPKYKRTLLEKDKIALRNAKATLNDVLKSSVGKATMKNVKETKKGSKKVGSRRANNSGNNQSLQALRIADRAIESAIHNFKGKNHGRKN